MWVCYDTQIKAIANSIVNYIEHCWSFGYNKISSTFMYSIINSRYPLQNFVIQNFGIKKVYFIKFLFPKYEHTLPTLISTNLLRFIISRIVFSDNY